MDEWTKWRQSVSGTALDNGWYRHAVRLAARYQWYTLTGTENWHPKKEDKNLKQPNTSLVEETTVPQEEEEPNQEEEEGEEVSDELTEDVSVLTSSDPLMRDLTHDSIELLEDNPPDQVSLCSLSNTSGSTSTHLAQPKKKYTHVKDHIRNTNREEVESLFPFLSSFPYEDGDILVREAPFGGHSFDAAVYSPSRNEAWIVEGKCKEVHHGAGQLLFYKHLASSLWKEWKEATRTHLVLTLPCRPKERYLPFLSDHTIEVWWKE